MTYIEIKSPPPNASECVKVHSSENRDEFIRELAELLSQKKELICTEAVPIEWITSAFYSAHFDGHNPYRVLVLRARESCGYFFIERRKQI